MAQEISCNPMLVLFDIDATLLKTQRAGLHAIQDAVSEFIGAPVNMDGIRFAGGLDPLIIESILHHNGHAMDARALSSIRIRYAELLRIRLAGPGVGIALPGTRQLIKALEATQDVTLGLLTGNFEETGRAKLEACGIDSQPFLVNVFGDASNENPPHRRHLPVIARQRFEELLGDSIPADHCLIIGDTPHDVDCALFNGFRVIGVATGPHDEDELARCGADLVVANLSETQALMQWICELRQRGR